MPRITPLAITNSRFLLSPIFFAVHQIWFARPFLGSTTSSLIGVILLWICYILIEVSDLVDGKMARKSQKVTEVGKILDPLADLFSKMTYFTCFVVSGVMPPTLFILLVYRELIMIILRMLMSLRGVAFAARIYGKIKAFFYFLVTGMVLLLYTLQILYPNSLAVSIVWNILPPFFVIVVAISVFSLLRYVWAMKNEGLLQKIMSPQ